MIHPIKGHIKSHKEFYGTTTISEKGQVVIPAEARTAMKLTKGEKLLVFGMGGSILAFMKAENVEAMVAHMAEQLAGLQKVIKRAKR
jgi:AbrB family looped-hinge helix DNA binding protein